LHDLCINDKLISTLPGRLTPRPKFAMVLTLVSLVDIERLLWNHGLSNIVGSFKWPYSLLWPVPLPFRRFQCIQWTNTLKYGFQPYKNNQKLL